MDGLKATHQIVVQLCKTLVARPSKELRRIVSRHPEAFLSGEGSRAEATRASRFERLQN